MNQDSIEDKVIYDANFEELRIGDRIVLIHLDEYYDDSFIEWYYNARNPILRVAEINKNAELLWVRGCSYAIEPWITLKTED